MLKSAQLWLVLCATVVMYAPVVQLGFAWDDHALIEDYSSVLASPQLLLRNLFSDLWSVGDAGVVESGYYRPVMLFSLAIDYTLFGLSAWGYHLQSVLWHLVCIVLLHRLALRFVDKQAAFCAAVLFAAHPVNSEAVIWIAARNDSIATAFLLAGLLVLWTPSTNRLRWIGGGGLIALAVLGKESALLAPAMLWSLDWARPMPNRSHRLLAAFCGVLLAFALRTISGVGAGDMLNTQGIWLFLSTFPKVLALQMSWLVWPWPLSGARALEWFAPAPWRMGLGVLVLAVVCGTTLRLPNEHRRTAMVGIGMSILGFLPALLPLASRGLIGERYLYLPMVGAGVWVAVVAQCWRRPTWAMTWVVLLGGAVLINLRIPDWQDDQHLWQAAMEDTPNPYVFAGLAHALNKDVSDGGNRRMASQLFVASLQASPPNLDACGVVVTSTLLSGQPQKAANLAMWSLQRGCPKDGDFVGRASVAHAFAGNWEAARELLEGAPSDPLRRDDVVRGALMRRDGDEAGYTALRDAWERPEQLDLQVDRILEAQ